MKSKHTDGFWKDFSTVLSTKQESRPTGSGWKNIHELKKEFSASEPAIRKALVESKAEVFQGLVNKNGRLVKAIWYRSR